MDPRTCDREVKYVLLRGNIVVGGRVQEGEGEIKAV